MYITQERRSHEASTTQVSGTGALRRRVFVKSSQRQVLAPGIRAKILGHYRAQLKKNQQLLVKQEWQTNQSSLVPEVSSTQLLPTTPVISSSNNINNNYNNNHIHQGQTGIGSAEKSKEENGASARHRAIFVKTFLHALKCR